MEKLKLGVAMLTLVLSGCSQNPGSPSGPGGPPATFNRRITLTGTVRLQGTGAPLPFASIFTFTSGVTSGAMTNSAGGYEFAMNVQGTMADGRSIEVLVDREGYEGHAMIVHVTGNSPSPVRADFQVKPLFGLLERGTPLVLAAGPTEVGCFWDEKYPCRYLQLAAIPADPVQVTMRCAGSNDFALYIEEQPRVFVHGITLTDVPMVLAVSVPSQTTPLIRVELPPVVPNTEQPKCTLLAGPPAAD